MLFKPIVIHIGAGKQGNMHRSGHFAADSFKSDRLLEFENTHNPQDSMKLT